MVGTGVIEDATRIWWDLRPSARYPTLEMRSTDVCTALDDAIAIAALFQCLMSMLVRLRKNNQRWRVYPVSLVNENRWLAQRHGTTAGLVDLGKGRVEQRHDAFEHLFREVKVKAALVQQAEAAHSSKQHRAEAG